ncbi:MAG TPA: FHA domain-containing protein, partial [Blastocatellia bacterium]
TSIPRPARPAREARPSAAPANEKPVARVSPEPVAPARTLVLSSRGRTESLKSDSGRAGGSIGVACKLVIERGGRIGREFPLATSETHIGRWDADSGIFPDVDLDQDDPEAKVSRRHARIISQNGQYFIEDLGSTNGTFVNRGRRLLPGHRHLLQSGDEIIVGKTFLKFYIIS